MVSMRIASFIRQQARLNGGVAGTYLVGVGLAALRELFGQRCVLHGKDLCGQKSGIGCPINRNSCHGDTRRHLNCGKKGIHAAQLCRPNRNSDNRQRCIGRDRTGQMCSHPGCGDQHTEPILASLRREAAGLLGGRCAE